MLNDELAIREFVETWLLASNAGDVATVLGLMTNDIVFMAPGAEPFGKEASANMQKVRMEGSSEIRELQVMGDWAYLRSFIDLTVTPPNGQTVRRSGFALTIVRKGPDGKWRISRDANLAAAVASG